jgi:hypothetical protein
MTVSSILSVVFIWKTISIIWLYVKRVPHPLPPGILHLDGLARDSYRSRHRAMSTEVKKEIAFEIGHVLFIDIVGYSKLLINEQSEAIDDLELPGPACKSFLSRKKMKTKRPLTGEAARSHVRSAPE